MIKIDRAELFEKTVEEALARDHALKQRRVPDPPPLSPLRRLLNNPLFYLPLAAAIGVFAAWRIMPMNDLTTVGGEVMVANKDPWISSGGPSLTVGTTEFNTFPGTKLLPGANGQKAFESVEDIKEGDVVEIVGIDAGERVEATAIRPATRAHARATGVHLKSGTAVQLFYFPLIALFIAFSLLFAEALTSRNWMRVAERMALGTVLAALFGGIATLIPGGIFMRIAQGVISDEANAKGFVTIRDVTHGHFIIFQVCRSLAWAGVGAALGVGLNLVRATRPQLRNSVLGGALGGAFGGALFDPIDRFVHTSAFTGAELSRLLGCIALGMSIGLFLALVDRLAREAWVRVRTGPLAGKAFVLYKTPTRVGSSPDCDIYLFKDAEIDGLHAAIHRVGNSYDIEDLNSRLGTDVMGQKVRQRRLQSGDQITIGGTVLEFEERAKR